MELSVDGKMLFTHELSHCSAWRISLFCIKHILILPSGSPPNTIVVFHRKRSEKMWNGEGKSKLIRQCSVLRGFVSDILTLSGGTIWEVSEKIRKDFMADFMT